MTQRRDRGAPPQPPTGIVKVGDMVHYHRPGENTQPCRAAVVTHVVNGNAGIVHLFVFPDGLGETNETVVILAPRAPSDTPGMWHTPE